MLVITGIFENERFIPDKPVSIPQKKKVIVTIEEQKEENEFVNANKGASDSSIEPVDHSAFGRLQAYANPSLISEEQGAWEAAIAEKHALR